jgi:hypothetical protein
MAKVKLAHDSGPENLTILGDSRALTGLIPSRLGPQVVNLALGGSTPIEGFFFARKIADRAKPPQAVILSYSPDAFLQADWFWYRTAEFGFLDYPQINEVRLHARGLKDKTLFGPGSPGDFDARFKSFLYAIKFPSYFFPALWKSHLYQRYPANQKMWEDVLSTRGQVYLGRQRGSTTPDSETKLTSFIPAKINDYYFDQTLALLASRHIPVYFLAMPHNAASDPFYFPGLKDAFAAYLQQCVGRYSDFHVLGDPFFSYPSECFSDYAHMNELGAVPWSDHVAQLLNDAHVAGGPYGAR